MSELKLREYQRLIHQHILEHDRSMIFASMGMGKTSASLAAIRTLRLVDGPAPTLVLAPKRVALSTWPNEVRKWDQFRGLRVSPIIGDVRTRRDAAMTKADIYTINYDNLPWLVDLWGDRWPYRNVIADESTRLKNFRTKQGGVRSQALSSVAHTKIEHFIGLTGTPAPNGLQDLWGQLWFVDAGMRLGRTYKAFKDRWFQRAFDGHSVDPLPYTQDQIQRAIKDVCLTVDAKDWFDLQEPIHTTVTVRLPMKARAHYREMEKQMFTELERDGILHDVEAVHAAARTIKCLQIANGAPFIGEPGEARDFVVLHDEKLDALESIIEEANGMPVLVAYHFKPDLIRLLKRFPKGRWLDSNPQTEKDWNEGKIPVLFAHPASAGHGLNLQYGGNIIAFFGHWWNLEERQQIIERIGPVRQAQAGFDRPVFIYDIVAEDTVDELVMARNSSKATVQEILLEAMKNRKDL